MSAEKRRRRPRDEGASSPAMEDEADVVAEVGARLDESGELVAREEDVSKIGAVDSDSVRENRRLEDFVKKKRGNVKGVTFNADDLLTKYETMIKVWPPNTLDISVKRLTGSPVERVITSRPRTGAELYAELQTIHGAHEEAKYAVKFFDSNGKEFRGNGQITMPDTRSPQQQGYSPMNAPYPYGHPQAPSHSSPNYSAPQPPPFGADPMAMMRQMFAMFNDMREAVQQPAYAPPTMQMPPPPPSHADPQAMMGWMQEMFRTFQQMQVQQQPVQRQQPQAPVQLDQMAMMKQMFELFKDMRSTFQPSPQQEIRSQYRSGPYPEGRERVPYLPPAQAQRPQTAAEQFREALTVVRTAVSAAQEINDLIPSASRDVDVGISSEEPDAGQIKIVDMGGVPVAFERDGVNGWMTGLANLNKVLKWVGEQREEFQKSQARLQQNRPARQLPHGYVEVTEGYVPPPGYVAVPVNEPPPAAQERDRPVQGWEMPPLTEEG